jgi:hypothetical protein
MSFISNLLLKERHSLRQLPELVRQATQKTINSSETLLNHTMLGRLNWYYPDAKLTLASVD